MAKQQPNIIIIKGIRPGLPTPYFQLSYGDVLADYNLVDMDDDENLDYLWNMRN